MTKNTKVIKFMRKTIAPNVEQVAPKRYRARVKLNKVEHNLYTTSIMKAKRWAKLVKTTGNPNVTV